MVLLLLLLAISSCFPPLSSSLRTTSNPSDIEGRLAALERKVNHEASAASRERSTLKHEMSELKHLVSGLLHSHFKLDAYTGKVTNNKELCAAEFSDRVLSVGQDRTGTFIIYSSDTFRYGEQYIEVSHKDATSALTYGFGKESSGGNRLHISGPKNELEDVWGQLNPFHRITDEVETAFKKQNRNVACERTLERLTMAPGGVPQRKYGWIDEFIQTHREDIFRRAREIKNSETNLEIYIYRDRD
ncbi:hypothetical protein FOL47_007980 [Perkinsus chesapeaki]|uniref:Uncharacterized protein n=1 Tax=Perkinsus chesapeaki TaxID=330153 RepID=A0A7J6LHF3_PERCH|nr:hypothetical protein FOL47_007980 [Perkinsus chesapeaki]